MAAASKEKLERAQGDSLCFQCMGHVAVVPASPCWGLSGNVEDLRRLPELLIPFLLIEYCSRYLKVIHVHWCKQS